MNPFDLPRRLKDAPLEPALKMLREIHRMREGEPGTIPERIRPAAGATSKVTSSAVAALRAIHERKLTTGKGPLQTQAAPSSSEPTEDTVSPGTSYDRVRQHFHRHEAGLRRQAWLTDQILDQLQTDGVTTTRSEPALQQELRLRCPLDGATGGGFVLANEFDHGVEISFRRSVLRGAPVGWEDAGDLRFSPERPTLEAGSENVVRLSLDFTGCPFEPGDEVGVVIDVLGDEQLLLKLWVLVSIHAAHATEDVT